MTSVPPLFPETAEHVTVDLPGPITITLPATPVEEGDR